MEKKIFYSLDNGFGEGGIMTLGACMQWIDGDMADFNPNEYDGREYTLTPVWMTDEEYNALPDQD